MKKSILLILGISITILLVFSCKKSISGSSSSSIIGEWLVLSETWTETWDGDTESETFNYETDDLTFSAFINITENSLEWCENIPCGNDHECEGEGTIEITNSEIILTWDDDEDEEEDLIIKYDRNGKYLELIFEWEDEEDGVEWFEQIVYVLEKYDGDFPPEEWASTPNNDNYEPDNNLQSATSITVNGASQEHMLICGEEDWYKFNATSGTDYTIETTSILDTYIKLYDANGDYLTEDDDGGENVNAKLQFSASYNGIYYFVVHGYDYDEWETGPYSISVRTGAGKSTTNNIIDKNKKQRMLPNFKTSLKRF